MKKLEQKYFSRKEVANYFGISIQSLVRILYENGFKELILTGKRDDWGRKLIRIDKTTIEKLENKLLKK